MTTGVDVRRLELQSEGRCSRSRALLEKLTVAHIVKNSPHSMNPEGVLPSLQGPCTGPCPEPDESNLAEGWDRRWVVQLSFCVF
jgi:hypothetical protein